MGSFGSRDVCGLEFLKLVESFVELAIQGDFVAEKELVAVEGAGFGHGSDGSLLGVAAGVGIAVPFEGAALHLPIAADAPAGDGQRFDEDVLGGGGGLVFVHELAQEGEEAGLAFGVEHYALGEEAVAGAVSGGIAFSLFGDWAEGAASVGSGSFSFVWWIS